jgi:DNA-binding GntR family transcriptional regulator
VLPKFGLNKLYTISKLKGKVYTSRTMDKSIQHRTLARAITAQLRQEILNNTLSGGTQLRQDALASAFGVSRIPVREALIQLDAEGLVQLIPHKGAVVTKLAVAEVNDVFDLRAILEVRMFRASIPNLNAADFEHIDTIQERFAIAIQEQNSQQWGTLNKELHTALYARADLPQTATMVANLLQKSDRYTRVQLSSKNATQQAQEQHGELIQLAKQKLSNDACDLLSRHIEKVRLDLLELLATPSAHAQSVEAHPKLNPLQRFAR